MLPTGHSAYPAWPPAAPPAESTQPPSYPPVTPTSHSPSIHSMAVQLSCTYVWVPTYYKELNMGMDACCASRLGSTYIASQLPYNFKQQRMSLTTTTVYTTIRLLQVKASTTLTDLRNTSQCAHEHVTSALVCCSKTRKATP